MMRSRSGCGMGGPGMMAPVGKRNRRPGNCPYDSPTGGYGMGPGYGKGPGMKDSGGPDSENIRQYEKGQDSQPE
jgi:hypothetical protein